MTPEEVADVISNNIKVKFLNTKYVNENLQLKLPYQFYEQPYIIGYIRAFSRWSCLLYSSLVLKKEKILRKEQLDFNSKVYKFLNLPFVSFQTYLKLDSSKNFQDKYFSDNSDKNNNLWFLGNMHAKVSVFASYSFKSKNLSDKEKELYESIEEFAKNSPNILPTDTYESKFGSAILELTIWKYLENLKIHNKTSHS